MDFEKCKKMLIAFEWINHTKLDLQILNNSKLMLEAFSKIPPHVKTTDLSHPIKLIRRPLERDFQHVLFELFNHKQANFGNVFIQEWVMLLSKTYELPSFFSTSFREEILTSSLEIIEENFKFGRIDISIEGDSFIIGIEIKLQGYNEGKNQTIKQQKFIEKYCKKNNKHLLLFFLNVDSNEPLSNAFFDVSLNTITMALDNTIQRLKSDSKTKLSEKTINRAQIILECLHDIH